MDSSSVKGFIPDNQFKPDQGHGFIPDNEFVSDEDKYSTAGQQLKTAAEGAAQGVAGPLADLAETKLLGVDPKDIRGRAEANPGIHGASQVAGLVGGSLIPGVGEYSLGSGLSKAGLATSKLASNLGVKAASRAAAEMGLMAASDETSKWLQNDPNQSMQSAIANVGLSAALGGVLGGGLYKTGQMVRSLGKDTAGDVASSLKSNLEGISSTEGPNGVKDETSGYGQGIAKAILSHLSGGAVGAAIGHTTGIPGAGMLGAYIGDKSLSPMLAKVLPYLGQRVLDAAPNPEAFVDALNVSENAIKGKLLLEKAAQSIFSGEFPSESPSKSQRNALDDRVQALQGDPMSAQNALDSSLAHYMPDHTSAIGQTVGQTVSYLSRLRPSSEVQAPLDPKPQHSSVSTGMYDKALNIAENPISVMKSVKNGTLTSNDILHLSSMYPALYDQMKSATMNSMVQHLGKGKEVPYSTKMSLSLFLGQPLDSSMTPQSIQLSMPMPEQQPQPGMKPKHSTSSLPKIAQQDLTPMQARQTRAQKA